MPDTGTVAARYDTLETKLAKGLIIAISAITITSDFDGAVADGKPMRINSPVNIIPDTERHWSQCTLGIDQSGYRGR